MVFLVGIQILFYPGNDRQLVYNICQIQTRKTRFTPSLQKKP